MRQRGSKLSFPSCRLLAVSGLLGIAGACGTDAGSSGEAGIASGVPQAPPPPPAEWAPLIGEYATETDTLSVLEEGGALYLLFWKGGGHPLLATTDSTFEMAGNGAKVTVRREADGSVRELGLEPWSYERLALGGEEGSTFQITPLRPPGDLRAEALEAKPPAEVGDFLPQELVELVALDPTLRLDIRYATSNNFMGEVFYSRPRAFLQRPAVEALIRVHEQVKERGYGLMIHDAYRPWYVTKMFWDATPEALRVFVADPASGSRHNRGCAIDLTLFDLETGEVVTMPAGFDEMSPRSHADYPGGTARQRWHRKLLRDAMEAHGFTVYDAEWWHFDYEDWSRYSIGNQVFEEIGAGTPG